MAVTMAKKQPPHTHVFRQEICFSYKCRTKSGMKIDITGKQIILLQMLVYFFILG